MQLYKFKQNENIYKKKSLLKEEEEINLSHAVKKKMKKKMR